MLENLTVAPLPRHLPYLAKARNTIRASVLLGAPVLEVVTERQSIRSSDPGDWSPAGPPVLIPVDQIEEFVFHLREVAREAAA